MPTISEAEEVPTKKRKSATTTTASADPDVPKCRRVSASSTPSTPSKSGPSREAAGVLVGETPQKRGRSNGARPGGSRGRADGCQDDGGAAEPASPAGRADAQEKALIPEEMASSAGGDRSALVASSPTPTRASARGRSRPSPPPWGATSGASRLFVEESPGDTAVGSRAERLGWSLDELNGGGDGLSRELVRESPSSVPRPRPVVPGTPA